MKMAESSCVPGERGRQIGAERGPENEKYSGRTRAAILVIGSLLSWILILLPVWLLSGN